MKRNKTNYLVIILYSSILILILLGGKHIYGSNIDWINQHTVFPKYFRDLFYETQKLIPNYAFNIGAGQNIFNYSYYGLMSPIILVSYLLPFIKMESYISSVSMILYILSGILLFKFLKNHNISNKLGLLVTIVFQTLPPLTYQFHHHIMFVWYIPFLILAILGVDRYMDKEKSLLLMSTIFLIIAINYYYSIPCLLVIVIYGIYRLLSKKNNTFKRLIIECLKFFIRLIIPIVMAAFILIPTIYTMSYTKRTNTTLISLSNLLLPNIKEILYSPFGIGLSFLMLISPLGNLCSKKIKKNELFLNITIVIVTIVPIFMYILNGLLYVRGKVLIPFLLLYIISLVKFINRLVTNEINIKKFTYTTIVFSLTFIVLNITNYYVIFFIIDSIITSISLKVFIKNKKLTTLFIPFILTLALSSICNNYTEIYVEKKNNESDKVEKLLNKIEQKSLYRTDNRIDSNNNVNRIYKNNYYTTSIYSSIYNSYYWDFYNFKIGNNIERRNMLNTSGADNYLFNKIMGVKYIISNKKKDKNYRKVYEAGRISLYKNEDAFPLIYITDKYGSKTQYNKLKYPYNIEYLMNNPVTEKKLHQDYNSSIEKLDLDLKDEYKFTLKKNKKFIYKLNKKIENKLILISFDMNYNELCQKEDVSIKINGIKNKLTCKDWLYHNKNNNFQYVISTKESIDEFKIIMTKGKYDIANINIYTMDYTISTYKEVDQLRINKKESIITGKVNIKSDSYIITSFPYDKGFEVFIDNKKVEKEIVNTAFLGAKISKGSHGIKIKYTSPGYKLSIFVSNVGLLLLFTLIIMEEKARKKD